MIPFSECGSRPATVSVSGDASRGASRLERLRDPWLKSLGGGPLGDPTPPRARWGTAPGYCPAARDVNPCEYEAVTHSCHTRYEAGTAGVEMIPPNAIRSLGINWDPTWQVRGLSHVPKRGCRPSGVDAGWPVPRAASAWMQEDLSHVPHWSLHRQDQHPPRPGAGSGEPSHGEDGDAGPTALRPGYSAAESG